MLKRSIGVVVSVGVLAAALPAAAATKGPQATDVSCDAVTVKSGVQVTPTSSGAFKIKFNSAASGSGDNATWFTARSAQGNDLSQQARVVGETASWSGVIPSTYTTRMQRRFAANCNGALPGNGNYTVNYTVTYQA